MKDRIWDIVGSLTGVVFVVLVFISVVKKIPPVSVVSGGMSLFRLL